MIKRSIFRLLLIAILIVSCNKIPDSSTTPTVFINEMINIDLKLQDAVRIGRLGFPENNKDHAARLGDGMITGELWGNSFWISSSNPGSITNFGAETFVNHDKISEDELKNKIRSLVSCVGPNAKVIVARCGKNIVILNRNQFSNDVALVIENQSDWFALLNFERIPDEDVENIITYLGGLRIFEE